MHKRAVVFKKRRTSSVCFIKTQYIHFQPVTLPNACAATWSGGACCVVISWF